MPSRIGPTKSARRASRPPQVEARRVSHRPAAWLEPHVVVSAVPFANTIEGRGFGRSLNGQRYCAPRPPIAQRRDPSSNLFWASAIFTGFCFLFAIGIWVTS